MIARLRWDDDGPAEAVLGDDFTWTGARADTLNALLSVENTSPARGRWWVAHVGRMATMLGATAEFAEAKPAPPGTIF